MCYVVDTNRPLRPGGVGAHPRPRAQQHAGERVVERVARGALAAARVRLRAGPHHVRHYAGFL